MRTFRDFLTVLFVDIIGFSIAGLICKTAKNTYGACKKQIIKWHIQFQDGKARRKKLKNQMEQ